VQWSDGTYSLDIGDELFDMNIEALSQRQLFTQHQKFSLYKGTILKRMIIKPPQTQK
jgi:hypothetical protein